MAWDANGQFKFGFHDHSADVLINSINAAVIKRATSAKINNAKYFLSIVGSKTHKSKWVDWKIEKAVELKKKIVAVKVGRSLHLVIFTGLVHFGPCLLLLMQ